MFLLHHLDHTIKKVRGQIANVLTLVNLGLGVCAIMYTLQNEYRIALLFITIAALCDRLDGACARRFNSTSEFGKQLDSLSDIISFGAAPALLIYQVSLFSFGLSGILITVFFIACGAIRLARYNISENEGYFTGLPITVAGCILAFQLLFVNLLPNFTFLIITFTLSLLMISSFTIRKI